MNAPLGTTERAELWRANQRRTAALASGAKPEPDAGDMQTIATLASLILGMSAELVTAANLAKQSPFTLEAARRFEQARGSLGLAWAAVLETDAGLRYRVEQERAARVAP